MRHLRFISGAALLAVTTRCQAQGPAPGVQEVHLSLRNATPVDALLEVSRKAKTNVLADTTDLPPDPVEPERISGDWQGALPLWQWNFGRTAAMGTHLTKSNTLLCWVKPDIRSLAQQAGAQAQQAAEQVVEAAAADGLGLPPSNARPEIQDKKSPVGWRELLVRELRDRTWGNGEAATWPAVPVRELPPLIRQNIVRRVQDDLLSLEQAPMYFWMDESFWARARLKVTQYGGQPLLSLGGVTKSGPNFGGQLFTGLALLEKQQP